MKLTTKILEEMVVAVLEGSNVDPLKVLSFHNQMSGVMSRGNWLFKPVVYTDAGTGRKDEEANLVADLNTMAIEAGKGSQEKAQLYVDVLLPFVKDKESFYNMIG